MTVYIYIYAVGFMSICARQNDIQGVLLIQYILIIQKRKMKTGHEYSISTTAQVGGSDAVLPLQ